MAGPSYCDTCNCHTTGACRFCAKCGGSGLPPNPPPGPPRNSSGKCFLFDPWPYPGHWMEVPCGRDSGGGGGSGIGGTGGTGGAGSGGTGGGGVGGGTGGSGSTGGSGGGSGSGGFGNSSGGSPGSGFLRDLGGTFLTGLQPNSAAGGLYGSPLSSLNNYASNLQRILSPASMTRYRGMLNRTISPAIECRMRGGTWVEGNPITGEQAHCGETTRCTREGYVEICNAQNSGRCITTEQRCMPNRPHTPPKIPFQQT